MARSVVPEDGADNPRTRRLQVSAEDVGERAQAVTPGNFETVGGEAEDNAQLRSQYHRLESCWYAGEHPSAREPHGRQTRTRHIASCSDSTDTRVAGKPLNISSISARLR